MNLIQLLGYPPNVAFTPEEEELITNLLAEAYSMDEGAATNPEIQRIVEKVKQRLSVDATTKQVETNEKVKTK